jgi:iron complex outermembrane receptor protein
VVVDLTVEPDLHFTEVVSVSPNARSAFESYQPTTVLAGQDLDRQLAGSLGAVLEGQAGMALRSLGPAPSRPVIRGLDGDRVLILEDGQRTGDISSQSGDHGVPVNPAAATRIEVVRGPATLLYGANAIGGLVNVITDRIPAQPVSGTHGSFAADLGSGAAEAGGAGAVSWGNSRFATHVMGSGRRSGDVATPAGRVANSHSRMGEISAGAAWTGERAYVGGSYGFDDSRFGVPVVEEGVVELTPRRHQISVRSGGKGFNGPFESYRATFGYRRYQHQELEAGEPGTLFRNHTTEVELLGSHRPFRRLTGTIGGWVLARSFEAVGEEALSPPVDQRAAAAFMYEELTWPHVTLQYGARLDHTRFAPDGGLPSRDFTNVSASAGLLYRPAAAHDAVTFALSVARAARNPALEELYFFGPHAGNFAFEIGNPDLGSEKALGVDASFRWRTRRVSGEVTYFRNDIADYIFRSPVTDADFGERFDHLVDDDGDGEAFPIVEFAAADSVLQGVEAHADLQLTGRVFAELGVDYVKGELKASGVPLPRMPPLRVRSGVRYQVNAFQAGGELSAAARQDRTFGAETPTVGFAVLDLYAVYSFEAGGVLNTLTARLDNATDELYRNHLSLVKDVVPEMGRSFKLVYRVAF